MSVTSETTPLSSSGSLSPSSSSSSSCSIPASTLPSQQQPSPYHHMYYSPVWRSRLKVLGIVFLLPVAYLLFLPQRESHISQSLVFILFVITSAVFVGKFWLPPPPQASRKPITYKRQGYFRLIFLLAFILTVLLPWIFFIKFEKSKEALIAPHLFVFSSQIFLEITAVQNPTAPIPLRIAEPLMFLMLRFPLLYKWTVKSYYCSTQDFVLALSNLVFWVFILIILISSVLPDWCRRTYKNQFQSV